MSDTFPRWVEYVKRYEDMTPTGSLTVMRQPDGDVIVRVVSGEPMGDGYMSFGCVEFCTPMAGGGGSERTWLALIALAAAMEDDENERKQNRQDPAASDATALECIATANTFRGPNETFEDYGTRLRLMIASERRARLL